MDLSINYVIDIAKEMSDQTKEPHFMHWTDLLQVAALIYQSKIMSRAAERLEGI